MASWAKLSIVQIELLSAIIEYVPAYAGAVEGRRSSLSSETVARRGGFGHGVTAREKTRDEELKWQNFLAAARAISASEVGAVGEALAGYFPPALPLHHQGLKVAIAEAAKLASIGDTIRAAHANFPNRPLSEPDINDPKLIWG